MTTAATNKIKYLLATKAIHFANDTFKIALMANTYTFNKDSHHGYANVSANEVANGFGYTTGGATLANVAVTEDDTDDRCEVTWDNVSWTANGGNIGPTCGAIIYDDTEANDAVVGFIDFGGNETQADGGVLTIANVEVRIA
jgi:hypothetical protein